MDGNSTTDDYVGVYEATLVVTDTSVGKQETLYVPLNIQIAPSGFFDLYKPRDD